MLTPILRVSASEGGREEGENKIALASKIGVSPALRWVFGGAFCAGILSPSINIVLDKEHLSPVCTDSVMRRHRDRAA